MKKILESVLALLSKAILNKYKPDVVAITGSVGKTSTKDFIYEVLRSTYSVRGNIKNYNNEIGLPLTIIGSPSASRSLIKWLFVFTKALGLILFKDKNYPDILVLEMGADRPGDIKRLCQLVPVRVGVVTEVAPAHSEFLGNLEDIAHEKGELIKSLPENGEAVLNYDNKFVYKMSELTSAHVNFFGSTSKADVYLESVKPVLENGEAKTVFNIKTKEDEAEVVLQDVLASHLSGSILSAVLVGLIFDLDLITISKALSNAQAPKGRMRVVPGVKKTILIDDSYNSSPLAAKKAVEELAAIQEFNKKYAVLGDMLELGNQTEELHQELGEFVAMQNIDYLITVGEISRDIDRGAIAANMSKDNIFNFKDSKEAGLFLQNRIEPGDILLIKGSQGVRMERIVKELMASPEKAHELLVRQDSSWQN